MLGEGLRLKSFAFPWCSRSLLCPHFIWCETKERPRCGIKSSCPYVKEIGRSLHVVLMKEELVELRYEQDREGDREELCAE